MNISSAFSIYQTYCVESQGERRNSENPTIEPGYENINTGPDTVTVSNAANEQYLAMKNSFISPDTDNKNSQYSSLNNLLCQSYVGNNEKMSQGELLAFFKSDTF